MIEEQPPNLSFVPKHVPGGWVRATIASSMQIFYWTRAVALQVQRVTELRGRVAWWDTEADLLLLTVALRQLLRAAELEHELTEDPDTDRAVQEFVSRVPGLKEARDVLEHFDDYILDRGKDPKAKQKFKLSTRERTGSGLSLVIGPYTIDITRAGQAAADLGATLLKMSPEDQQLLAERSVRVRGSASESAGEAEPD